MSADCRFQSFVRFVNVSRLSSAQVAVNCGKRNCKRIVGTKYKQTIIIR